MPGGVQTLTVAYEFKSGDYYLVGTSGTNLVFTPQLFDLTEMYGAGNEPSTVEQFKQDFPLDYYNYSPKCWVGYYKKNYIISVNNVNTSIPTYKSAIKIDNSIIQ